MAKKMDSDHVSGRGARIEIDFFGGGMCSGYIRPADDTEAATFAKQPVPTSIGDLPRGVPMRMPFLRLDNKPDASKGLRFRIRKPNPHEVRVSWLRSAYLLLFSLLGSEGYGYVRSRALRPVREQIMNPDEIIIKGCLNGEWVARGTDFPVDPLITMTYAHKPTFWAVTMGERCVFLPVGGLIDRFHDLTREPIDLSFHPKKAAFWASTRFGHWNAFTLHLETEQDLSKVDFIGGLVDMRTSENIVWEWLIVDHQSNDVITLPFRIKGEEDIVVVGMVSDNERRYMNQEDREKLFRSLPTATRCITVGDKVYPIMGPGQMSDSRRP